MGGSPAIARYDDARFFTLPGVGPADPAVSVWQGGIYAPAFSGIGVSKSILGRIQLPHSYKEGSDIVVHIHWGHKNAGATANQHLITDIVTLTGTGKNISSLLMVTLKRDPADALDTYTGSAWFLDADAHVQYDAIGSNNIFTKD